MCLLTPCLRLGQSLPVPWGPLEPIDRLFIGGTDASAAGAAAADGVGVLESPQVREETERCPLLVHFEGLASSGGLQSPAASGSSFMVVEAKGLQP